MMYSGTTNGPITSSGMTTTIALPTDMPTTDSPTIERTTCMFLLAYTCNSS